jgi:hypothetical protein
MVVKTALFPGALVPAGLATAALVLAGLAGAGVEQPQLVLAGMAAGAKLAAALALAGLAAAGNLAGGLVTVVFDGCDDKAGFSVGFRAALAALLLFFMFSVSAFNWRRIRWPPGYPASRLLSALLLPELSGPRRFHGELPPLLNAMFAASQGTLEERLKA